MKVQSGALHIVGLSFTTQFESSCHTVYKRDMNLGAEPGSQLKGAFRTRFLKMRKVRHVTGCPVTQLEQEAEGSRIQPRPLVHSTCCLQGKPVAEHSMWCNKWELRIIMHESKASGPPFLEFPKFLATSSFSLQA